MIRYPDTSVLVAALTNEAATDRAQDWLGDADAGRLMLSGWTVVEFSSALAIKERRRTITSAERAAALARFGVIRAANAELVEPVARDYADAAKLIDDFTTKLRAADALHLAIARRFDAVLWTLDKDMADAGTVIGLGTRLLG